MRLLINGLSVLMIAALIAGWHWHGQASREQQQRIELTRAEVDRFQRQITFQAAMREVRPGIGRHPPTVDPAWFEEDGLPENALLDDRHPWVQIADASQRSLHHPPDRVATTPAHARFWYNPGEGIVRARVPALATDAATLQLYNDVNGTSLADLFGE